LDSTCLPSPSRLLRASAGNDAKELGDYSGKLLRGTALNPADDRLKPSLSHLSFSKIFKTT
jgi:hypothetical protein